VTSRASIKDSPGSDLDRIRWSRRSTWFALVFLTAVVGLSLARNLKETRLEFEEAARIQARAAFDKDVRYRRWNAQRGGVYAPVTADTPPNPHLDVEHRDILGPDGIDLTLINPAYMTRQVHELSVEEGDLLGHITSLHPIRPENAPDPWETSALEAFETGANEVSTIAQLNGAEYTRLMGPLVTEAACLKCHASQGYTEGDVRGGISVAVPMAPLRALEHRAHVSTFFWHGIFWALMLIGVAIWDRSMARWVRNQEQAKRDRELLHRQLLQSQRMDAVGGLAGGISHDFNNMLAMILTNAGILLDDSPPDDPNIPVLKDIIEGAERSKILTMKLLTFARKEKIDPRNVAVRRMLKELESLLARSISKKVRVETRVDCDCLVHADHTQIPQALLNICVNGADAMPDGGTLSIKCRTVNKEELSDVFDEEPPNEACLIEIKDTGVGMDEEACARAIEPFYTTKDLGHSTGLGLSVTHGIILSHGGRMRIHSQLGEGTRVQVYLPTVQGIEDKDTDDIEVSTEPVVETVLVVDDEPGVLRATGRALKRAGFGVFLAGSGPEAVELYRERQEEIGVVVLDLLMPDMDGGEVYRAIKAINPGVKAVLTSGYSRGGQANELLEEGIQVYVQKPCSPTRFCDAVRQALESP